MPFGIKPLVVDVSATFEAKSGYHLTPGIENKFDRIQGRYRKFILMGSKFGGKPKLFTEPRGMSASARIEVGRRMWRRSKLRSVLVELLPLFREVHDEGVSSGPLAELVLTFEPTPDDDAPLLAMTQEAFLEVFSDVFGDRCVFRISGKAYEIGKAKVYEPLVDYVRGVGPYTVAARRSVEDLSEVIQKEKGTFEDVRIWVSVAKEEMLEGGTVPPVYYSARHTRADVERMAQEKWEHSISHLTEEEVEQRGEALLELRDYLLATRTRGNVWTMKVNVVRAVRRDYLPVLAVMLPETERLDAGPQAWLSWEELAKLVSESPKVSKSQATSSSFLEKALANLCGAELAREKDEEYSLAPDFFSIQHVRYYSLGAWKG